MVVESGRKMIRGDRALCINDTELSDAGKYVCHVSGLHFTTELSVQGEELHVYIMRIIF